MKTLDHNLHCCIVYSQPILRDAVGSILKKAGVHPISQFSRVQEINFEKLRPSLIILIAPLDDIGSFLADKPLHHVSDLREVAVAGPKDGTAIMQALENGLTRVVLDNALPEHIVDAVNAALENSPYFQPELAALLMNTGLKEKLVQKRAPIRLTSPEMKVMRYLCQQLDNHGIADEMHISVHTVLRHKQNIKQKIGAKTFLGCVLYAIQNNMLSLNEVGFGVNNH